MRYVTVPTEITVEEIAAKNYSFSPVQYQRAIIPNPRVVPVSAFLTRALTSRDLGVEVGSVAYIPQSPVRFIRTKALQAHSFLPDLTPETALPVNPRAFVQQNLRAGDVLISKDSNIGEAVILDEDLPGFMTSGALYRLPLGPRKLYLLAFIKHDLFREQLDLLVPAGATIRHAKTLFLDCLIPLPPPDQEAEVVAYVEALTAAVIAKETEIRRKHAAILDAIDTELRANQGPAKFVYEFPGVQELEANGRLDAGRYTERFKRLDFLIRNYRHGYKTLTDLGYTAARGQNLQVSNIGNSVYSDSPQPGFYQLAVSGDFTVYGTVSGSAYIGNKKPLKLVHQNDILLSCRGDFGRAVFFPTPGNLLITILVN